MVEPVTVGKLHTKSLAPSGVPQKYAHLLPDPKFTPYICEFDLSGVGSSVANAIRRTMMSEMSVIGFYCDGDIKTTDPFISRVEELFRTRMIVTPVMQSTPTDAVYRFRIKNETDSPLDVPFGQLQQIGGKRMENPCEPHAIAFVLGPHHSFECTVKIDSRFGNQRGNGGRQIAVNCASIARGFEPLNTIAGTGESVSTSNIRNWTIRFTTNGIMAPLQCVRAVIANLVDRLRVVRETVADNIRQVRDEWELHIDGTYTISKLLEQHIYDTQSGIDAVVARVDERNRESTLRLKTQADPIETIIGAVDSLIGLFGKISAGLQ